MEDNFVISGEFGIARDLYDAGAAAAQTLYESGQETLAIPNFPTFYVARVDAKLHRDFITLITVRSSNGQDVRIIHEY